ncbi:disease resistance protein [Niveomyces insectorum RCEF 264]|uniref:Putative gamma-glutamylcyclotransferase n=1 Tax=Niveomyces insectorum RCEF 264 TaxID=1081102 RepID=A0A162JGK6_9HYPO|nr:disease resistance protein [Niveomyces insectorum RCEF 264]
MAPEVFFTVCYRTSQPPPALAREHTFRPAVLPGYTRHRVRHEDYPGVMPDGSTPNATVRGMLVSGLTAANLYHLDVFEGAEYERRVVSVVVDSGDGDDEKGEQQQQQQPVAAQVYVFRDEAALEPRPWDYDEFRREKMHSWTRADYTFDT